MFIMQPAAGSSPYFNGAATSFAVMSCQAAAFQEQAVPHQKKLSAGLSRSGKLRRSPSNLSHDSTAFSIQSICLAEAKQIEFDFVSCMSRGCSIRVRAPTGEESGDLLLKESGDSVTFSPIKEGCGHGEWTIQVISVYQPDNMRESVSKSTTISLEGVGSLFFSIDDSLVAKLVSQEFLHLPQASLCSYHQH